MATKDKVVRATISNGMPVSLKWGRLEDLPVVYKIDQQARVEDLWLPEWWAGYLAQEEGNRRCFVARLSGVAVAACCVRTYKTHNAIAKLVVVPAAQRKGLGRLMLDAVFSRWETSLPSAWRPDASTVTRETDLSTQLFLRACGWRCEKIIRDWYDCPPEDGYLFARYSKRLIA